MLHGVIWRDDGLWIQLWHVCCAILTRGRVRTFPPKGFVGRTYGSSRDTAGQRLRVRSLVRLPLNLSIDPARLWRLTYELEGPPPVLLIPRSGPHWVQRGNGSGGGGEEGSIPRIGIILTSGTKGVRPPPPTAFRP
jgi:hypothetical protein